MPYCHLYYDELSRNGEVILRQELSDITLAKGLGKQAAFTEASEGSSATFFLERGELTTTGIPGVPVEVPGSRKPICLTGKSTRIVLIAE